jgi:RimJ/RimL family protein N-acetyltransferase
LIGFVAFGDVAQVPGGVAQGVYREADLLDFGIGLEPELTGRGLGLPVVQAALQFARETLGARGFRLSVATFNRRAIRVYERAGFEPGETFTSVSGHGVAEFLLMRLRPTGS